MSETGTEIVRTQGEVLAQLNEKVAALVARGKAIKVVDQNTCIEAKQFKNECKSYEKAVELYADGDIQSAKERLGTLQNAKKMLLLPEQQILETVESDRKRWEEEERRKAEREAARINEERRVEAARVAEAERKERERLADIELKRIQAEAEKLRKQLEAQLEAQRKAGEIGKRELEKQKKLAAEQAERDRIAAEEQATREKERAKRDSEIAAANVQTVTVAPSIPSVSGTASRRNWKFKTVDATKIPRQYLMPDDVEIGRMVRDEKNKELAEAKCPGIEVWSE